MQALEEVSDPEYREQKNWKSSGAGGAYGGGGYDAPAAAATGYGGAAPAYEAPAGEQLSKIVFLQNHGRNVEQSLFMSVMYF